MINEKTISLIKRHEGLRLEPYKDSVGVLTVGYGHNLEVDITEIEASRLLKVDLQVAERECNKFHWYHALDEVRQSVILNMMFNMGMVRFSGFRKTINYIENGQYFMAATEMLDSKWSKQVGRRAVDLSYMMRTGEWYEYK